MTTPALAEKPATSEKPQPLPKVSFTFISDPGHSWLILSPAWLDAVGLTLADISTCSYQCADGILALEEDCDAPAFIKAFEARAIA